VVFLVSCVVAIRVCEYLFCRGLLVARIRLHEHIGALSNVLTSLKDALGDCATVFTEEDAIIPRAVSITVSTLCEGFRGESDARLDGLRDGRHGHGRHLEGLWLTFRKGEAWRQFSEISRKITGDFVWVWIGY
jgi:hypothetical protein